MLSFATEFPLSNQCTRAEFRDAVIDWIVESPHATFTRDDFSNMSDPGEWSAKSDNDKVQTAIVALPHEDLFGIQRVILNQHIEWTTTIVFSRNDSDAWVGVRTSRESSRPAHSLPAAKKPIIVRSLLERFGGARDGDLIIRDMPHCLGNDDIRLAGRLISGAAGSYLPIVYVSCEFVGGYIVDVSSLAYDLAGMAHVVVEPNRPFSRRLQIEVDSDNVYGGTIGVYWPDGGGRRSFFLGKEYDDSSEIKRAIVDEVRTALLNHRPLWRCTWPAVQEALSKQLIADLKASGSKELARIMHHAVLFCGRRWLARIAVRFCGNRSEQTRDATRWGFIGHVGGWSGRTAPPPMGLTA
jgi:hypothetical protein